MEKFSNRNQILEQNFDLIEWWSKRKFIIEEIRDVFELSYQEVCGDG
jgi:hypothetical protein